MSESEQAHRYLFVHMLKTAGTALRRGLINHFGAAAVYPAAGMDDADFVELALSIDHLRDRLAARGDQIRVITGHFPLCTAELIDGRFTTLTVLRDPVERTLSYLRHHRENSRADRHRTLEEIYDTPFRFQGLAHNHMTKMLALTPVELVHGMPALTPVEFTREHLERAKEALAGMDAVGFQERFDDFCDDLAARFGWDLGAPETTNTSVPVEVPERFRARVAEDNAFDVELYEFAKVLLDPDQQQEGQAQARHGLDSRRRPMAVEKQIEEYEGDPGRWGHSLANVAELLNGCLDASGAKSVVEVGAYAGDLTRVLLDWATDAGGRVVGIEPDPQPRLVELSENHPELELVRETSHDALRHLPLPDAVIIDGDHNYYTVSEELRLIDERAPEAEFPLLMLHDVGWPHGRRDAYWAPERIPEEHRHPLVERGQLFPGEPGLADQGLPMYSTAKHEGGPRNGVRTAVEDFVDRREDLRLAVLPPFFGFGVVWRRDALYAAALAEVVDPWDGNPLLERLEANRVHHLATAHARSAKLMYSKAQVKRLREEKRKLERQLRKRDKELERLRKAESVSR
jgi:hypothetical protein